MVSIGDWATSANKAVLCLRFLLVEAAQAAARFNPEWRSKFLTFGDASRTSNRQSGHGA